MRVFVPSPEALEAYAKWRQQEGLGADLPMGGGVNAGMWSQDACYWCAGWEHAVHPRKRTLTTIAPATSGEDR